MASNSMLSSSPDHQLTKRDTILVSGITAGIVIIGTILIAVGLNEPLYTENSVIFTIFNIITQFGSDYGYIVFFILIYFTMDKEFAERVLFSFLTSLFFTSLFKLTFQDPRPLTNTIEEGYGFPSGHTSGTVSFWGYVLVQSQDIQSRPWKRLTQIFAGFLLICVPLSRMIIGVHDLGDIVGGFALAGFILLLYLTFEPKIRALNWTPVQRIVAGVLYGLLLWILGSLALYIIHPANFWVQVEDLSQAAGLIMGMSITIPLEHKFIQYNPKELSMKQKIIAGLIGIIIGIGLYFGLSALFGLFPENLSPILRGVRYLIYALSIGLGVTKLLTVIFKKKD